MGGKYSPYAWFHNSTLNDHAEGQERDGNIGEHLFMHKKFLNRVSQLSCCSYFLENGLDANAEAGEAPTSGSHKREEQPALIFSESGKKKKIVSSHLCGDLRHPGETEDSRYFCLMLLLYQRGPNYITVHSKPL